MEVIAKRQLGRAKPGDRLRLQENQAKALLALGYVERVPERVAFVDGTACVEDAVVTSREGIAEYHPHKRRYRRRDMVAQAGDE